MKWNYDKFYCSFNTGFNSIPASRPPIASVNSAVQYPTIAGSITPPSKGPHALNKVKFIIKLPKLSRVYQMNLDLSPQP